MVTVLAVLASGFLAGLLHVVSGVDHLAALLPLSVGWCRGAFTIGVRWGLGHSAGVLLVGLFAVALKHRLDVEGVEAWGESLVGVALVAIGLFGVRNALRIQMLSASCRSGRTPAAASRRRPSGPGRSPAWCG